MSASSGATLANAQLELPPVPEARDLRKALADGIERATNDPEFAPNLDDPKVGTSRDDLRNHLEAATEAIWGAVAEERQADAEVRAAVEGLRRRINRTRLSRLIGGSLVLPVLLLVNLVAGPGPRLLRTEFLITAAIAVLAPLVMAFFARRGGLARELAGDAAVARARLLEQLYTEGIKPIAREVFPQESWETSMPPAPAPGLAELTSTKFEVSTKSRNDLVEQLENLRGGAIGVSGPRGAGKTTLIESFCSGRTRVKGQTHIGVSVSAPVHYDARDFVVHLITRVCEAVIGSPRGLEAARRRAFRDLASMSRRQVARGLALIGVVFGVAAFFAAGRVSLKNPTVQTAMFTSLALLFVLAAYVMFARNRLAGVDASYWRRRPDLEGLTPFQAAQVSSALFRVVGRLLTPSQSLVPVTSENAAVVERAVELYRETKFQQTYSSGWSGSLKLPAGVGLGGDSKMSWAQLQMSLPELVERLREFLEFVVTDRGVPVIIGIDELDKIGSNEDARAFLNGIKAVFGVPGVYFLVSVSQDAMSSFERRGLPFRDVFDSSFDEVIDARYLDFDETQRLLRRRVIGMPTSYHALCHVLSGAVPRDVIRVARALVAKVSEGGDLATVATALVDQERREKAHATQIAAKKTAPQDREALLRYVAEVERVPTAAQPLLDSCARFKPLRSETTTDSDEETRSAADLAAELNVFSYYCAVVLEIFATDVDAERLADAAKHDVFEGLARARQGFALSHTIAWERVEQVRARPPIATAAPVASDGKKAATTV